MEERGVTVTCKEKRVPISTRGGLTNASKEYQRGGSPEGICQKEKISAIRKPQGVHNRGRKTGVVSTGAKDEGRGRNEAKELPVEYYVGGRAKNGSVCARRWRIVGRDLDKLSRSTKLIRYAQSKGATLCALLGEAAEFDGRRKTWGLLGYGRKA